jgi:hypothetical protein
MKRNDPEPAQWQGFQALSRLRGAITIFRKLGRRLPASGRAVYAHGSSSATRRHATPRRGVHVPARKLAKSEHPCGTIASGTWHRHGC